MAMLRPAIAGLTSAECSSAVEGRRMSKTKNDGEQTTPPPEAAQPPAPEQEPASPQPQAQPRRRRVPVDDIKIGDGPGNRTLSQSHVDSLATRFLAGEPVVVIVVDENLVIVDGRHTYDALLRFRDRDLKRFNKRFGKGVWVRSLTFDAKQDPERAVRTAMVLNFARRQPSGNDIDQYVRDLLALGFVNSEGRPRNGERSACSVIMHDMKVSESTARRWIRRALGESPPEKPVNVAGFRSALKRLRKQVPEAVAAEAGQLIDQLEQLAE